MNVLVFSVLYFNLLALPCQSFMFSITPTKFLQIDVNVQEYIVLDVSVIWRIPDYLVSQFILVYENNESVSCVDVTVMILLLYFDFGIFLYVP